MILKLPINLIPLFDHRTIESEREERMVASGPEAMLWGMRAMQTLVLSGDGGHMNNAAYSFDSLNNVASHLNP